MVEQVKGFFVISQGRLFGSLKHTKAIGHAFLNYGCRELSISFVKTYAFIPRRIPGLFWSVCVVFRVGASTQIRRAIVRLNAIDVVNLGHRPFTISERPREVMGKIEAFPTNNLAIPVWSNAAGWTVSRDAFLNDAPIKFTRYWIKSQEALEFIQRQKIVMDTWRSHIFNSNSDLTVGQAVIVG